MGSHKCLNFKYNTEFPKSLAALHTGKCIADDMKLGAV